MENNLLLSICIPTYNRPGFLSILLTKLYTDNIIDLSKFEVLIGDNSDNFDSKIIVDDYLIRFNNIIYSKHANNIGAEDNFQFLLNKSKGIFFLILGDDDYISNYNLFNLLNILSNNKKVGLVNLNRTYNKNCYFTGDIFRYDFYSKDEYFVLVNLWLTHISSNIINKSYLHNLQLDKMPVKTQFPHIFWMGFISKFATEYIIIKDFVIYCTPRNSFGYDIFNTFSKDLFNIINVSFDGSLLLDLKNKISNVLLINFFPQYLIDNKLNSLYSNNSNVSLIQNIFRYFKWNWVFYISVLPFLFLPVFFFRVYNKLIRIFFKY